MTRRLYFEFFYYHSIPEMLMWGVLLVGAWTLLSILFHRKGWSRAWIWINRILLTVVVLFILYWTVGKRNPAENGVSLIPFYSFIAAQTSSERYRSLVANVLLFIQVGLSMPFSLPRRFSRHPVRTTILFAAVLSFLIEVLQLVFGLGLCETDDVIANTAGAAIGTLAFVRSSRHRFLTSLDHRDDQ